MAHNSRDLTLRVCHYQVMIISPHVSYRVSPGWTGRASAAERQLTALQGRTPRVERRNALRQWKHSAP